MGKNCLTQCNYLCLKSVSDFDVYAIATLFTKMQNKKKIKIFHFIHIQISHKLTRNYEF